MNKKAAATNLPILAIMMLLVFVLKTGELPYTGLFADPIGAEAPHGAVPAPPKLDINSATVEELARLPGIGPVLAGRIVARRGELSGFSAMDELLDVKGIGKSRGETLKGHVFLKEKGAGS